MRFHFALPSTQTYLDRIVSFLEADPECWIGHWRITNATGGNSRSDSPGGMVPCSSAAWKMVVARTYRGVGSRRKTVVLYSLFALCDRLHRHTQARRNVLNVHFSVCPSPLWFNNRVVPTAVRDQDLHALRMRNIEMERRGQEYADIVVVQADDYRSVYAEAFGKPMSCYRTIPNAVLADRNVAAGKRCEPWLRLVKDRPAVLFVGNLCRFKGVWDLLHAFVGVGSEVPEALLLLVGRTRRLRVTVE